MMSPSQRAIKFIQGWEECCLISFLPTPNDHWTIGWGETGQSIVEGMTWTQDQADSSFLIRLARFADQVNAYLEDCAVNQNQFDALLSFQWNTGALGGSTLLSMLKGGDVQGAASQFLRWDHQNGVELNGLLNRRKAEKVMFLS